MISCSMILLISVTDSNNSSHPFGQMEPQSHLAQIGISVEPLAQLSQQTPATLSKSSNVEPFVEFSKTMCENLFNYASSFSQTQAQMVPNPNEMFVPLSKLQQWYENFLRRLQQNPYFWRSWKSQSFYRLLDFYAFHSIELLRNHEYFGFSQLILGYKQTFIVKISWYLH